MAKNLGIDFGSTYTMLSYYDKDEDRVTAIQTENTSKYIPSIACLDEFGEGLLFGQTARNDSLVRRVEPMRAFKMLLAEQDCNKTAKHGYDEVYTPQEVTRCFLEHYTRSAAEHCSTNQFDSAVICIPEVWTQTLSHMSARSVLLNICKNFGTPELPLLNKIRVITEPVAASAYYVHNYKKKNQEPYKGYLIIIDYGGGTLDITLTEVSPSSKDGSMMIDAFWRTGSGENHDGRIGQAGLAYMERVTALALEQAGFPNAPMDSDFLRLTNILEDNLMHNVGKISSVFSRSRDPERLKAITEEFCYGGYRRKRIGITYGMLYTAFDELIKPDLIQNLEKLTAKLRKEQLDPIRDMDKLRIAVVGGFGQYPLVQKAVWEFFGYAGNTMDITHGAEGGKQDAISYGAALIAANEVTVSNKSRYSIGLRVSEQGKDTFRFAIKCRDDVTYNQPYPVNENWEGINYGGSSNPDEVPWIFAINDSPDDFDHACRMIPRPEILNKLCSEVPFGKYTFAFSMDESDIYTLHFYPCSPKTGKPDFEEEMTLCLGNFNDIFGMNAVFNRKNMLKRI